MKKNDNMSLWKNLNFLPSGDSRVDFSALSIGAGALITQILNGDSGYLAEYYQEGGVKQEASSEDENSVESINKKYERYFTKLGGRLIHKLLNNVTNDGTNYLYIWEDSIVGFEITGTYISIQAYSHREEFVRGIKDYFSTQWAPIERTGHIYAIIRQGPHLGLSSIGNAGIPLVDGNYTPQVMEDYKYVIRDLKSESPSGRISIMRGPAGTGKTHLIRAMLLEVPDAMFVLISPEIVTNLAGPELLPLLMNYRGGTTGPIVLVIEDADKCLVARESTDMNSIQALLNLGDGILGSLLDMRIVATTNADEFKMDTAILRPGRLSKMLDVGSLDLETARSIFKRLLPNTKVWPEKLKSDNAFSSLKMTLAEVYALARKNGWTPALREAKSDEEENYNE